MSTSDRENDAAREQPADGPWAGTRAIFLRRSAVSALGVSGMAGLLAACGDGGSASTGASSSTAATAATKLKPDITVRYDPHTPAGPKPGLPRKFGYVAFSNDPFWVTFSQAMSAGAKDAGIEFGDANAQGDAAKYIDLVQQQLTTGVAGTMVVPFDPQALAPLNKKGIDKGVAVVSLNFPPSTIMVGSDETVLGNDIGKATAKHINDNYGGTAQILLFNEDKSPTVKPRYTAFRATLKAQAPKAKIVTDISPQNTADDGFKQASSALAAHPDINVIIGPGLATLGAFSALKSTKKARPDMYIASIGGTNEELKAIQQPNSPYKVTWAQPWLLTGYLSAIWTAAWLDGKAVPMGVYHKTRPIDATNLSQYQKDMADPAAVVKDARLEDYMELWGSINYDTRSAYLTKEWHGPSA